MKNYISQYPTAGEAANQHRLQIQQQQQQQLLPEYVVC
jgi:hypothetical protein